MMFENLEDRRLLSASIANGLLTVEGTAKNDAIRVTKQGTNLNVQIGRQRQTFELAKVTSLTVNGLAGNDTISFGKDVIAAKVDGGDGNDRIAGTTNADTLNGGRGNDYIHALAGNDVVNGGDGKDVILGGAGNDTLRGNAGNDLIGGEAGDDSIFGDAGNDILFGAKGNDKVDGGDGRDAGVKDGNDTFTKVEKIWR